MVQEQPGAVALLRLRARPVSPNREVPQSVQGPQLCFFRAPSTHLERNFKPGYKTNDSLTRLSFSYYHVDISFSLLLVVRPIPHSPWLNAKPKRLKSLLWTVMQRLGTRL
jgi:hypothetical protein